MYTPSPQVRQDERAATERGAYAGRGETRDAIVSTGHDQEGGLREYICSVLVHLHSWIMQPSQACMMNAVVYRMELCVNTAYTYCHVELIYIKQGRTNVTVYLLSTPPLPSPLSPLPSLMSCVRCVSGDCSGWEALLCRDPPPPPPPPPPLAPPPCLTLRQPHPRAGRQSTPGYVGGLR